jgi:hypothetical protein
MNEWSHLTDEELQALIGRIMAEAIRPIFEGTTRTEVTKKMADTLERMTGLEGNVEVIAGPIDKSTGLATFTYVAKTPMGEAYIRGIVRDEELQALQASIH